MDVLWHTLGLGVLSALLAVAAARGHRAAAPLFFVSVAVLATWPLAVSWDALPANAPAAQDARLFLWDLWWVRTALLAGQTPFHTDLLFAPHGTALVLHGLAATQALATLPLQLLVPGLGGLTLAYAAVVLGSFALAGYAAWRLALRVVGDRPAALFCGLAFTLQSLHFASTVRFHALAIEWLPIVVLALLRVLERGRVRDGVWLGLAFVGAFHASIEYAYFLLLVGAALVLHAVLRDPQRTRERGFYGRSLAGAALTSVLLLPFVWELAAELRLSHAPLGAHARILSPDLLDLFLPDPRHAWLGAPIASLRVGLGLAAEPTAVSISATLLALAAAGCVRAWRRRRTEVLVWSALALVFASLMLGPSLRLGGHDTGVPGPYRLLAALLPFFDQARMPMRFGAVAQLGLALVAAYGLAGLAARVRPTRRGLVVAGALLLVAFEGLRIPLATERPTVPEAYRWVGERAGLGEAVLLDWPPGIGASAEIEGLHQIVHRQKLVQDLPLFLPRVARENRRTAVGPELGRFVARVLGSRRLELAEGSARDRLVAEANRDRAALGLRFVVLRRADSEAAVYERGRAQLRLLGPAARFEDDDALAVEFGPENP